MLDELVSLIRHSLSFGLADSLRSVGALVNSATITLEADQRLATTACFVGGVGECIFDARSGSLTVTAGPLDCSGVKVEEGQCVADYVGA